jgi:multiple sugar transport system permease protein
LFLFGLTVIYPMLRSLQFSFFSWPLGSASKRWIGLENYRRLIFEDDRFHQSIRNTLFFTVGTVVPTLAIALGVALAMNNRRLRARGALRTVYFLPVVTSLVAVSYVWRLLLEPSFGLVNTALGWVGVDGPGWLSDPSWAMPGVIMMTVWRDLGYYMVIFLAGLQTIPKEISEAARIDGASRWQQFRHVTLPLLTPIIAVVMTFSVLFTFTDFQLIYVLTRGGPVNATHLMATLSFQRGISGGQLGEGAAIAVAMIPFLLSAILFSYFGLQRRKWQQGGGD